MGGIRGSYCIICDERMADCECSEADFPAVPVAAASGNTSPEAPQFRARGASTSRPGQEHPEWPNNEELEAVWENHRGHPADFAADALERWGGCPAGLLGYGGALNKSAQPQQVEGTSPKPVDLIEAGALRQYRHNDGSEGFVFGYDVEITDRVLAATTLSPEPAKVGGAGELANEETIGLLIEAAERHASAFDDDDREGIIPDVLNAFYAGVRYEGKRLAAKAGEEPPAYGDMYSCLATWKKAGGVQGHSHADLAKLERYYAIGQSSADCVKLADVEALFNPAPTGETK